MSKFQELMQQDISRKEFLRYIGIALLGAAGVTSFLKSMTDNFGRQTTTVVEKKASGGYGMTPYGH